MKIPNTFRKAGFQYNLISLGIKSVIYEQLYCQIPKVSYFEVFQIKTQKGGERWGKVYEDQFRIPCAEDFGTWAWTFRSKEKAIREFNRLESLPD